MPAPASPLALRHRAAPGACAAPDQAAPLQMVWGRGVRRPQRPQRSLQPQRQNLALHVHYERAGGTWTHGYEYAAYTQSPSASAARAGRTASKKRPKWGKRHMRQSNPKAGRAPLLLTRAVGEQTRALGTNRKYDGSGCRPTHHTKFRSAESSLPSGRSKRAAAAAHVAGLPLQPPRDPYIHQAEQIGTTTCLPAHTPLSSPTCFLSALPANPHWCKQAPAAPPNQNMSQPHRCQNSAAPDYAPASAPNRPASGAWGSLAWGGLAGRGLAGNDTGWILGPPCQSLQRGPWRSARKHHIAALRVSTMHDHAHARRAPVPACPLVALRAPHAASC